MKSKYILFCLLIGSQWLLWGAIFPLKKLFWSELQAPKQAQDTIPYLRDDVFIPKTEKTFLLMPDFFQFGREAHPAEGIPLLKPQASADGAANLHFPLSLPPGRSNMQPKLLVSYHSEAENGWLGLGWNLSLPSVTLDTRWGVPRYNASQETETYLLNGEQLFPTGHRGELVARSAEKRFYPRVERNFEKIIRHGDSPRNYWWEVTDKTGLRRFYGGRPGSGLINEAVLKDEAGNIAHWALVEERDLNDNQIRYQYVIVEDRGNASSTTLGRQIYPNRILYTGNGNEDGLFSVVFVRDRQLNERQRADVNISGRLGFKQVSADLLRRVEIRFRDQLIRTYEMNYVEGAFFKTLLSNLVEKDASGQESHRHGFEYFDDVRRNGQYNAFRAAERWTAPSDTLRNPIRNNVAGFGGQVSALGGTAAQHNEVGAAITAGLFDASLGSKTSSAGGTFAYFNASTEGLSALIDINGDGLADRVIAQNGRLFYHANQVKTAGIGQSFGPKRPISGDSLIFGASTIEGTRRGQEGNALPYYIASQRSKLKLNTDAYFADFNGDGLPDLAIKGRVFFNKLDAQGNPSFSRNSQESFSPIANGAAPDLRLAPIDPREKEVLIDEFPLHDVVRVWEAPYVGVVTITAPVQLLPNNSPQARADRQLDGVQVSIQVRGELRWVDSIRAGDFGVKTPNSVSNIRVNKGDQIFFRVQSRENGLADQVKWDPEIEFVSFVGPNERDANNKRLGLFRSSSDYLLAAPQSLTMPRTGQIRIEGVFQKPITTDSLRLEIRRNRGIQTTVLFARRFTWDSARILPLDLTFDVQERDEIVFQVISSTNVDWKALSFKPKLSYVRPAGAANFIPLEFYPAVDYTMYNDPIDRGGAWVVPQDGTYTFEPLFFISGLSDSQQDRITYSIKGRNRLFTRTDIQVINNVLPTQLPILRLALSAGDSIYVEFHIPNRNRAIGLSNTVIEVIGGGDTTAIQAGVFTVPRTVVYGPQYRSWGQFAFNGNRTRAGVPFSLADLSFAPPVQRFSNLRKPQELGTLYDPTRSNFIPFYADPKSGAWRGADEFTYLEVDTISSSRMGKDNLNVTSIIPSGTGVRALNKSIRSTLTSEAGNVDAIRADGAYTRNESENLSDMLDLNGDRYPDALGQNALQYTNARGGLESTLTPLTLGLHRSLSESAAFVGAVTGGNLATSRPANSAFAGLGWFNFPQQNGAPGAQSGLQAGFGQPAGLAALNGNNIFVRDKDRASHTWMDVNGDELPDKVFTDGKVALNLGYRFLPAENWLDRGSLRSGRSRDVSAGPALGFNAYNRSIAVGSSLSRNESAVDTTLQDLNGDGLMDLVLSDSLRMRVRLNTGSGFARELVWVEGKRLEEASTTSEASQEAFTTCIILPAPTDPQKVCFTPMVSGGTALSRPTTQVRDLDGDGFPDILQSSADGEIQVQRSAIGRTNFLRKITAPLGASYALEYTPLGNSVNLPEIRWVLSSLQISDGLSGDGVDTMKMAFAYENPIYNRHERAFLGFSKVEQRELNRDNSIYRNTVRSYRNQNFYEKNLLASEVLQDGQGNKIWENQHKYELRNPDSGAALPNDFGTNDGGRAHAALTETTKVIYEGKPTPALRSKITYVYDRFGNVTTLTDQGDSTATNLLKVEYRYHDNEALYLKSTPSSVELSNGLGLLRRRQSSIDAKGNVVQVRHFLTADRAAEYDLTYDKFGNVTRITRPANDKGQRLFYAYKYEDTLNTYAIEISDAYGYKSQQAWFLPWGKLREQTDLNGQKVSYQIDRRGRLTAITGPKERLVQQPYTLAFEYHPEAVPPYALVKHWDPEHRSDWEKISISDGLQRIVQRKNTTAIFNGTQDVLQLLVSGRQFFDAFGRVEKEHFPIVEGLDRKFAFNLTADPIQPIETKYDLRDRPLEQTRPDGSKRLWVYDIAADNTGYVGLRVQKTGILGRRVDEYFDHLGRLRAKHVRGADGGTWTTLRYNGMGQLISQRDHEGNLDSLSYDLLGRLQSHNSAQNGLSAWTYDLVGNPQSKITANIRQLATKGGSIGYRYEYERLIQIDYPKNFQNRVNFTYGKAGEKHNRGGRLWLQEDASGGQELFFGTQGEVVKNIRSVLVSQANVRTFISQYEYDTWNRIQRQWYPDGELVTYAYNRGTLPSGLTGKKGGKNYPYVAQAGYDKFGQRSYLRRGNGTVTRATFTPTQGFITEIDAVDERGRVFQKQRFSYNPAGDLLTWENQVAEQNFKLGGPHVQKFTYDSLGLLLSGEGSWRSTNRVEDYQLQLTYDKLDRISEKIQTHRRNLEKLFANTYAHAYHYDKTQPYSPDSIGNFAQSYDANGNLIDRRSVVPFVYNSRQVLWDEENRVQAISDNGYQSRFTYDAQGKRVLKSSGGVQGTFINGAPAGVINHRRGYLAYVSPYLTAEENSFVKHYYLGEERVLSKVGTGKFNNKYWFGQGISAGARNYAQRYQNLEDSITLKYYRQLGIPPGPPTLPGYYAQPEFTGNGLPADTLSAYNRPPINWPRNPLIAPAGSVPGAPIKYGPNITNDNVLAGFGFDSTGVDVFLENDLFYVHRDARGLVYYLTDLNGEIRQHNTYLPMGELFVRESSLGATQTLFLNDVELDAETGLYFLNKRQGYYDARNGQVLRILGPVRR
jgi:YD repeat-containing protein